MLRSNQLIGFARRRAGGGKAHRHWRIRVDDRGSYAQLYYIGLYLNSTLVSPDNMTSNTAPSPYVVTESSKLSSPGYVLFDGSTSTSWINAAGASLPDYITLDMGSGNEITVDEISIYPQSASKPKEMSLDYSDDGTNWTEVWTQDGLDTSLTANQHNYFDVNY